MNTHPTESALCGDERKMWNGETYRCGREAGHRGEHRGHAHGLNASWPTAAPCNSPGERFYERGRCGCGHPMAAHIDGMSS